MNMCTRTPMHPIHTQTPKHLYTHILTRHTHIANLLCSSILPQPFLSFLACRERVYIIQNTQLEQEIQKQNLAQSRIL